MPGVAIGTEALIVQSGCVGEPGPEFEQLGLAWSTYRVAADVETAVAPPASSESSAKSAQTTVILRTATIMTSSFAGSSPRCGE